VKTDFYDTMNSVAHVLKEFDKTTISIKGHADSTGTDAYNMSLSQRRAGSVSGYLSSQGVSAARLGAVGFGESQPIAPNDTADGRRQNRRVEIVIDPKDSEFDS
jgi:outer membrane protein OmpA-like peptidoglycan-associated protein